MGNGCWTGPVSWAKRVDGLAATLEQPTAVRRVADAAWQVVYGRAPDAGELTGTLEFLNHAVAAGAGSPVSLTRLEATDSPAAEIRGTEKLLWRVPFQESLPGTDLTIEAVIQLDTLYPSANVRTIVSHWDGDSAHRGWSFGVTSEKSGYQPRNLILQLTGPRRRSTTATLRSHCIQSASGARKTILCCGFRRH